MIVTSDFVDCRNNYNLTEGGGVPPKHTHERFPKTDEWKRKVSLANKGYKPTPETIEKLKLARSKYKWTDKMREGRMRSTKNKGDKHFMFGKSPSNEIKRKISESLKGKFTGKNCYQYKGDIYQVCKTTFKVVGIYDTAVEAFKSTGIGSKSISLALLGKSITSGGFIWTRSLENVEENYRALIEASKQTRLIECFVDKVNPETNEVIATYDGYNNTVKENPFLNRLHLSSYFSNRKPTARSKERIMCGFIWRRRMKAEMPRQKYIYLKNRPLWFITQINGNKERNT